MALGVVVRCDVMLTFEPIRVPLHMDDTGTVRVSGTRVTFDTVIHRYQLGDSPEEIAEGFSSLPLADIYAVISYYLQHRAEADAYLRRREEEAAELRRFLETRYDTRGIRERLLARRAEMEAERGATADSG